MLLGQSAKQNQRKELMVYFGSWLKFMLGKEESGESDHVATTVKKQRKMDAVVQFIIAQFTYSFLFNQLE